MTALRSRPGALRVISAVVLLPQLAVAVDGVIEINQAAALAGEITPDDAPGFPVTLSTRGSYRLTGALSANAGPAILIQANAVELDLNGFSVLCGLNGACGTEPGIDATGTGGLSVRNGIVQGFGGSGIVAGDDSVIEQVKSLFNGDNGIVVGQNSRVHGCLANGNGDEPSFAGGDGIVAGVGSVVSDNVANDNGGDGISGGSTIVDNATRGNGAAGITAGNATIARNTANNNNIGIVVGGNGWGMVKGNVATDNTGVGLSGPETSFGGTSRVGYAQNVFADNNGATLPSSTAVQVAPALTTVDLGDNLCQGDSVCP